MQKICVATYYTDNYQGIANTVIPIFKKYCALHNYIFYTENITPINFSRHPQWYKICLMQKLIKKFDIILYIDIDAVITRLEIEIENLIQDNKDFYVSKDIFGLNSGVIMLKNASWLEDFFTNAWNINTSHAIYKKYGILKRNVWHELVAEQLAITAILESYNQENIKWMPQKFFNAYSYKSYDLIHPEGEWDNNSFIYHVPGLQNLEQRIKLLNEHII